MKEFQMESQALLKNREGTHGTGQVLAGMPVIYGISAALGVIVSAGWDCLDPKGKCIRYLSDLPLGQPFVLQAGLSVAFLTGIISLCYYALMLQRLRVNRTFLKRTIPVIFALLCGALAQLGLFVFGVSGRTTLFPWVSQVGLVSFYVFSALFVVADLLILFDLHKSVEEFPVKSLLGFVIISLTFVHCPVLLWAGDSYILEYLSIIVSYELYFLNIGYVGLLCGDLRRMLSAPKEETYSATL